MKTKKLIILIIALILVMFPYVPISADGEKQGVVDIRIITQEDLQNQINGLGKDGGVVKLSNDIELSSSLIFPMNNPITIDGDGHALTLKPGTDSRHISVSADNHHIVLKNLRLKGNGLNDIGGGISVNGSVTLDNCVVENNYAPNGGGIICTNGTVTLRNATKIVNNKGYSYGGGVYVSSNGFLMATDSVISDNRAARGGGIFATGGSTGNYSILLDYCSLENNRAATTGNDLVTGGAIATEGGNTEAKVLNSTFKNNYSENSGGAIRAGGLLELENTSFKGNKSDYVGGALYLEAGLNVKGGEFSGNQTTECGGAIYADDNAMPNINIQGVEFTDNKADRIIVWDGDNMEHEAFAIYKTLLDEGKVTTGGNSQPPNDHPVYGDRQLTNIFNNYDVNVYTKWPLTFHLAGGSWQQRGDDQPYTLEFETDEKVALDDTPVREGHTFDGWYTEQEAGERVELDALVLAQPQELYARWISDPQPEPEPEKPKFKVVFELSRSDEVMEVVVEQGGKLTEPMVEYTNHRVQGWYIDDGDTAWDFENDTVQRDMRLVAYWERIRYPVFD